METEIAVKLAPNSLQTQAQLGFILMQLKRWEEARAALQRALNVGANGASRIPRGMGTRVEERAGRALTIAARQE